MVKCKHGRLAPCATADSSPAVASMYIKIKTNRYLDELHAQVNQYLKECIMASTSYIHDFPVGNPSTKHRCGRTLVLSTAMYAVPPEQRTLIDNDFPIEMCLECEYFQLPLKYTSKHVIDAYKLMQRDGFCFLNKTQIAWARIEWSTQLMRSVAIAERNERNRVMVDLEFDVYE